MNSDLSSVVENKYKSRTGKQIRTNQSPTYNNTLKRYTNEFTDKFKIEPNQNLFEMKRVQSQSQVTY